jgi:serine/threonine protein kinase
LLDLRTFAQLLVRNPSHRPPQPVVPIMIGVLDGLHAAHTVEDLEGRQVGLIHRKVSPQNIVVGVDGDAHISDFGVAKARAHHLDHARHPHGQDQPQRARDARGPRRARSPGRHLRRRRGAVERLDRPRAVRRRLRRRGGAAVHAMDVQPPSTVGLAPPPVFDDIVQ